MQFTEEQKKIAFKKLRQLYRQTHGTKPPTYKDDTANGLTSCIIDYLTLKGWQAERIHCMGRPIPQGDGTYRMGQTTMDKGTADISATIQGFSVKVEVKTGRDQMSSHQYAYQQKIEKAGGIYIVARDFPKFLIEIHKRIEL